jgi:hypothetical protein
MKISMGRNGLRIEKTILGDHYSFRVVAERGDFAIEATDLSTLRYSSICNLNAMLSQFDIPDANNDIHTGFADSRPCLPLLKGIFFFKKAVKLLHNSRFRDRIEQKCFEDRAYGEWENVRERGWQNS